MLATVFFLMPMESGREMLRGGNTSADARIGAKTRHIALEPPYSLAIRRSQHAESRVRYRICGNTTLWWSAERRSE